MLLHLLHVSSIMKNLMNVKRALMDALRFVTTHLARLSAAVFLDMSWMRMDAPAQVSVLI